MTNTSDDILGLSPGIQSWLQSKGWASLRPIQSRCITPIFGRRNDILITAPTASGKTEAAFLPIISWLETNNRKGQGYGALCLSPLKALINDQAERLTSMCAHSDIDVIAWHGDANPEMKKASWSAPSGISIMTPESLEALFACRSAQLRKNFISLGYIVIDEYHAFFDSERGIQLISLLSRIEHAIGRVIPRIAISATIADPDIALDFLRPGQKPIPGKHCGADGSPPPVKLKIKSFPHLLSLDAPAMLPVAQDLFQRLRGTRNIIFAGSKRYVEELTQFLNRLSVAANVQRQFYPHHGSLSKETREETESVLKDDSKIVTAIATSTLEMGIDVNNISSVAQVGAPPNVAAIKQRLGRSGRREGSSAILRILIPPKMEAEGVWDNLNLDIIQSSAIVLLLLEGWVEPVAKNKWHLSTLIQQTLGIISSTHQCDPQLIIKLLCDRGPWHHIDRQVILDLLLSLSEKGLLSFQPGSQTIKLTNKGRNIASGFNFFTAFDIPKSYRLIVGKKNIGTLPATYPIKVDQFIIFGGITWKVISVDPIAPALRLREERGMLGKAPSFGGAASFIHERIRTTMHGILSGTIQPAHCDEQALKMVESARDTFDDNDMHQNPYFFDQEEGVMFWFIWSSSTVVKTIEYCLATLGYQPVTADLAIIIKGISNPQHVINDVRSFVKGDKLSQSLAKQVRNQTLGKFDKYAPPVLLQKAYLETAFEVEEARTYLDSIS